MCGSSPVFTRVTYYRQPLYPSPVFQRTAAFIRFAVSASSLLHLHPFISVSSCTGCDLRLLLVLSWMRAPRVCTYLAISDVQHTCCPLTRQICGHRNHENKFIRPIMQKTRQTMKYLRRISETHTKNEQGQGITAGRNLTAVSAKTFSNLGGMQREGGNTLRSLRPHIC